MEAENYYYTNNMPAKKLTFGLARSDFFFLILLILLIFLLIGVSILHTFSTNNNPSFNSSSSSHITTSIYTGQELQSEQDNPWIYGSFCLPTQGTITWVNNSNMPHTVTTQDNQAISFDSGIIQPGNSFSYQFGTNGIFYFYCKLHPNMKGRVQITDTGTNCSFS